MLKVLTPIFPPEIKPVRDGWYLFLSPTSALYLLREFRDGSWRWADTGKEMPKEMWGTWRGLAFDPAAAEERFSAMRITDDGPVSLGVFLPGATCC